LPPPPSESGSCSAEIAPIRREPREDAEQVTQALRGEPLFVHERCDGWARVETAYAYAGWIREEALGPTLPGRWPEGRADDVLAEARAYVGAPYEWGGLSERGIDCSGLVHMAFRRVGVLLPRDAWQQALAGEAVEERDMRPGDLVCYGDHVAFYAGDGRILHATGRDDTRAVVEEPEPSDLNARVRARRRISSAPYLV
jgi:cell wall-associated NlpC family hydrolase